MEIKRRQHLLRKISYDPRHQASFNTVYIPSKIVRNIKDKSVLTKSETKDYRVVYNKGVIVHNYYTLPYGFY